MTRQTPPYKPIFPDFVREKKIADSQGNITPKWQLNLSNLYQALQRNFTNEGIQFPQFTGNQVSSIQEIYTPLIGSPLPQNIPDISGKHIYDTTNNVVRYFCITYDNSNPQNITSASWKTVTAT